MTLPQFISVLLLLSAGSRCVDARLRVLRLDTPVEGSSRLRLGQPMDQLEFLLNQESRSSLRYLAGGFDLSMSLSMSMGLYGHTSIPSSSPSTKVPFLPSPSSKPDATASRLPVNNDLSAPPVVTGIPIEQPSLTPVSDKLDTSTPTARPSPIMPTNPPSQSPSETSDGAAAIQQDPSNSSRGSQAKRRARVVTPVVLLTAVAVFGLALWSLRRRPLENPSSDSSMSSDDSDAPVPV